MNGKRFSYAIASVIMAMLGLHARFQKTILSFIILYAIKT